MNSYNERLITKFVIDDLFQMSWWCESIMTKVSHIIFWHFTNLSLNKHQNLVLTKVSGNFNIYFFLYDCYLNVSVSNTTSPNIYLLVDCLVCLTRWGLSNHNTSCCTLGAIGKSLTIKDATELVSNVSTYGGEVIEYWAKFPLKTYLNQNWNLYESALLILLESLQ
jgi:hypothetical protein